MPNIDEKAVRQAKKRRQNLRVYFFWKEHPRLRFLFQVSIPIGAIALFVYGMVSTDIIYHLGLRFYSFTDILVLAAVIGDFLQGFLTSWMLRGNKMASEFGKEPLFGNFFLFDGLLFGLIFAALAATFVSDVYSAESPISWNVISLTITTGMAVIADFLWHILIPNRRKIIRNLP